MIKAYQKMGMEVTVDFVEEYLQNRTIAEEFTNFFKEFMSLINEKGFDKIENVEDMEALIASYNTLSEDMKSAVVAHTINTISDVICECEYEMYFAKNVLEMTTDIMDIYERNRSDYRYDTYSVSEKVRQRLVGVEEANFLSKIELTAIKNAVKFVDDVALKYARGRDEYMYSDQMTTQVNSEFEPVLKNYYDFLRNTKVTISKINNLANILFTGAQRVMFDKEIARNENVLRFESEPHYIDDEHGDENIYLEQRYEM